MALPGLAAHTHDDFDETAHLIAMLEAEQEYEKRSTDIVIPDIVCLSLGERCSVGIQLKKYNIATAFYPFDFMATPLKGLFLLLNNKFKGFLDKNALTVTNPACKPHPLVNNKVTGCDFVHDFADKSLSNYDAVFEKYQRRIDRFYKTIEQAKYIYFFRTHLKKHEAVELYKLLRTLYPNKQFSLIVPTDPKYVKTPWKIAGIQEFLMYPPKDLTYQVHGASEYWDIILKALKLIPA